MANKLTIALLLVVLTISGSIAEETKTCFTEDRPQDSYLLKNDHYVINLDRYTKVNSVPQYTIKVEPESANIFDPTSVFEPNGQESDLVKDVQLGSCTDRAKGLNDNDFVFLCDKKLVFLTMDYSNGNVTQSELVDLKLASGKCHSVSTSSQSKKVYTLCTTLNSVNKTQTDIVLYTTDPITKTLQDPLIIKQLHEADTLKDSLKFMIDEVKYEQLYDTILYIWENDLKDTKTKFRLVKDKNGILIDGGFYSTGGDTTKGLLDGQLVGFFHDGVSVMITTKKNGVNYIQRCERSPVYSKYICDDTTITTLESGTDVAFYTVTYSPDEAAHFINVFSINKTSISVGLIEGKTLNYTRSSTSDISQTKLKSITSANRANGKLFLLGPTTDDATMIDGILKFKENSANYDEYNFQNYKSSLSFVIENKVQSEYSYLITVGSNKVVAYTVKYNFLLVNTNQDVFDNVSSAKFTISCTGYNDTLQFTLDVLATVNGDPKFAVDNVQTYTGSKYIVLPTNGADISGNAPQISMKSELGDHLSLTTLLMNKVPKVIFNKDIQGINKLEHAGDGVYVAVNNEMIKFFSCQVNKTDSTEFQCTTDATFVNMTEGGLTWTHLDTEVRDGIALTVIATVNTQAMKPLNPNAESDALIKIFATRVSDGQNLFEPVTINFAASKATARIADQKISIMVIGSPKPNTPQGIYTMIFNTEAAPPTAFNKRMSLPAHVCPTELTWAPRLSDRMYIASVCGTTSLDNHIYTYRFNIEKDIVYQDLAPIKIEGSRDFKMCVQPNIVTVIDREQKLVYSITQVPTDKVTRKLYLPLKRYGVTNVVDHSCDEDFGLLQVLACPKDQECYVFIYRINEIEKPNRRVHSIQKVNPSSKLVASTFNDNSDLAQTLVLKDTTESIEDFYVLYKDGPHLELSALAVDMPKDNIPLIWTITYPGDFTAGDQKQDNTITITQNLTLTNQQTQIKVELKDPSKKAKVEGKLINLDELTVITGPYHSLVKNATSEVTMVDRLTPSNMFNDLKEVFVDAVVHKDIIFGSKSTGSLVDLVLVKDNKIVQTIENKPKNKLFVVTKGDKEIYFFSHSRSEYQNDEIVCFYSTDGGNTFNSALSRLPEQGFGVTSIIDGPEETFIFAGYNNEHQFSVSVGAFEIKEKTISFPQGFNSLLVFQDSLADFDISYIPQSNVFILIAGEQFASEARVFCYDAGATGLILRGSIGLGLVPNLKEVHSDIVFECNPNPNEDSNLYCVNSGKNMNSYLVRYEFDFSNKGFSLKRSDIVTYLRNIVNLKPIRVDFKGEFVSFVVQNKNPLKQDSEPKVSSFFRESYLSLIYRTDSQVLSPESPLTPPTRDVYKVLTSKDFGVQETTILKDLDPRLFINKDGQYKLGVNVGDVSKSLKVFNLDSLSISLRQEDVQNGDYVFSIMGIDNKLTAVKSSQFIESKPDDPKPAPGGRKGITALIIICIVVIIIVLVIVGIYMARKQEISNDADELNLNNDGEKTMKTGNDESVASGNYSKL